MSIPVPAFVPWFLIIGTHSGPVLFTDYPTEESCWDAAKALARGRVGLMRCATEAEIRLEYPDELLLGNSKGPSIGRPPVF